MAEQMKTQFLSEQDSSALFTFETQVSDSDADGYTETKEVMKRLAELGVVQSHGFGRYSVTAFGHWLIETEFEQSPSLPLRTGTEHNAREMAGHKLYMKEAPTGSGPWVELPGEQRDRWRDRACAPDAESSEKENSNGATK